MNDLFFALWAISLFCIVGGAIGLIFYAIEFILKILKLDQKFFDLCYNFFSK